jgi:hypothetical protein
MLDEKRRLIGAWALAGGTRPAPRATAADAVVRKRRRDTFCTGLLLWIRPGWSRWRVVFLPLVARSDKTLH